MCGQGNVFSLEIDANTTSQIACDFEIVKRRLCLFHYIHILSDKQQLQELVVKVAIKLPGHEVV